MTPVDGDGEAVGQPAGGLATEHQQFPADVVPACAALRAVAAGQVRLHDDAGADPGVVDSGAHRVDDADHLVAGAVRQIDERVTAARRVRIRTADADDRAADAHLTGFGPGLGHGLEDDVVDRVDDDAAVGAGLAGSRGGHHAVYPPSATSTDPVMNDAASLARNTTLGAISSGIAYRCCGASSIQ